MNAELHLVRGTIIHLDGKRYQVADVHHDSYTPFKARLELEEIHE